MLYWVLGVYIVGLGLCMTKPIPQALDYHNFADTRPFLMISNFNDVMSNLPFVIIGCYELFLIWSKHGWPPYIFQYYYGPIRYSEANHPKMCQIRIYTQIAFFLTTIWVGFGSAYYHLWPNNATLIWDRLPMAVAFMLLLTYILLRARIIRMEEYKRATVISQIIGIGSVAIWALVDDLRLYGLVQFGSLLIILILTIRDGLELNSTYNWYALLLYTGAKFCEHYDRLIYTTFYGISGHTLKHLLAATATYYAGQVLKS